MANFPKRIEIKEEGPREGFQIEKGPIATARKIELIDALADTGLDHIQIVSFVNPKRVPGMADAEQVVAGIVTATDAQLVSAMRFFVERMKLVVEPTGCLAAAAAFEGLVGVDQQVAEHLRQLMLVRAQSRKVWRERPNTIPSNATRVRLEKAFDIKFLNKNEKEEYAYQNTWAITTRMVGVMLGIHGDNKGM